MYRVAYGIFYLLSLLPWRVIYLISDFFYLLVYYVFKYRKKIVMGNLLIAFPEKPDKERVKIAKGFYKQFVDNFIEVIKLISISSEELDKRFKADYETINNIYPSGKNVQILLGHFFNWEFANLAYAKNLKYNFIVVYMPIENKIIDRIFKKMRLRFGTKLVPATDFRKNFAVHSKEQYSLILVGDQNPGNPDNAYWYPFFGKPVPFVKGPEKSSKYDNTAVVLTNFYRIKRGYYQSESKILTLHPKTLPEGEITKQMVAFIEETVKQHPSGYLWSHRRWKWEYDDRKHEKLLIR